MLPSAISNMCRELEAWLWPVYKERLLYVLLQHPDLVLLGADSLNDLLVASFHRDARKETNLNRQTPIWVHA